jgi:protein-tyrosine phosphatase
MAGGDEGDGEHIAILVVCTANQCRSPLAAVALQERADAAGLPIRVRSAGVSAVPGIPATPPTVDAARKLGLDLSEHASVPLDPDDIRAADLVIGLERRHVQEIVLRDSHAFVKTFTFKELARRGVALGPRAPGEPLDAWLARVHAGRRAIDLVGASADDDVADPTGSNAVDHRSTAEELDRLSETVLALLFE